jgi:hypothetical protein
VSGFDQLAGADCLVERHSRLGLAVVSAPEPLHYVSLFSHAAGLDAVVRGAPVFDTPVLWFVVVRFCWHLPSLLLSHGTQHTTNNRPAPPPPNKNQPTQQASVYDDGRYEVESKYTQTVAVWSRAVTPRLDLGPLAALLNRLEAGRLPEVGDALVCSAVLWVMCFVCVARSM